ncbi:hypothetical protein [Pseudoflavitalea rhizosphaerae]|uniref:hypothetical protein n=1 Tax=Pseudoflavitalea rhizosphaerae TaxID=1884793 RepID=UPI000F8F49A6|nr:hypothetical protein [Pseudoflavitalea rhizosphaerae]
MKTISLFIMAILLMLIGSHCAQAQTFSPQVINSSGQAGKKAIFYFDWSVGELALITTMQNADSSFMLTNGFLQPGTAGKKPGGGIGSALSNDEVTLHPNPTADNLYVTVMPKDKGQVKIYLFNQKAGLIYHKIFPSTSAVAVTIPMASQINGLYTLRIELYPENGEPRKSSYPVLKINK